MGVLPRDFRRRHRAPRSRHHSDRHGDAFIFKPGEPHQLTNTGTEDLILYVVADNPIGEACHYPDSNKWLVPLPGHQLVRSEGLDYYDGEE